MKEIDFTVDRAVFTCQNCGAKRDVYYTSGFLYGIGLFHTADGKYYSYINHFYDSASEEVDQILVKILGKDADKNYLSKCFSKVFGAACDPVNGVNLDTENYKIACIACGSDQLKRDPGPDEIVTVRFPVVTHENWDRLNGQEKEDLIRQVLKRKGCLSQVNDISITVIKTVCICQSCGAMRDIYNMSGFLYGEGFLHTEDGKHYVYINHHEDTAHLEVAVILTKLIGSDTLEPRMTMCFNKVFGATCDLVNGTALDAYHYATACLSCGSRELEPVPGSDVMAVVDFPRVTHDGWHRLSGQEKEDLIWQELKRKGCLPATE